MNITQKAIGGICRMVEKGVMTSDEVSRDILMTIVLNNEVDSGPAIVSTLPPDVRDSVYRFAHELTARDFAWTPTLIGGSLNEQELQEFRRDVAGLCARLLSDAPGQGST
jgi:hypothetical protein